MSRGVYTQKISHFLFNDASAWKITLHRKNILPDAKILERYSGIPDAAAQTESGNKKGRKSKKKNKKSKKKNTRLGKFYTPSPFSSITY